ncbi:MAG: DUF4097 family beta strand repeat protein [Gammaproteobacteria bacterium]|nr:DUF4097 family beta strand repeat protein [Gammaproteobacteria bacterium]
MSPKLAGTLAILAASVVTGPAFATQSIYHTRLSAPPGGTLTLHTDIGAVSIVGGSTSHVTFEMQAEGSASYRKDLHIVARTTADGVRISVQGGAHSFFGWFPWLHWFGATHNRLQLSVAVPSAYRLKLRTSGGSIHVRDIHAAVRASSSGGDADVQNITGALDVHTAGGDIQARNIQGAIELNSSGGDVSISNSTGTLTLHTEGGDISIRNANGRVRASSSGGDIRAELAAAHRISLSTAGGDITLLLPENTHAAVKAEAAGGSVDCDFPLSTTQMSGGDYLDGTIGGGGPQIALHSAGGDIHIAPQQ